MTRRLRFVVPVIVLAAATLGLGVLVWLASARWLPDSGMSRQPVFVVAVYASSVGLALIGLFTAGLVEPPARRAHAVVFIALVVAFGLLARLFLATNPHYNFDIASYTIVAEIVGQGGNVYAETTRYNYSPVWLNLLGLLRMFPLLRPTTLAFASAVRMFVSTVDLLTLAALIAIARIERRPLPEVAVLFFLNPVSLLISGYHGQFENLAVLLLLVGIVAYLKLGRTRRGSAWLWLLATLAFITKHNVFYQVVVTTHHAVRRWWLKLALMGASVALFAASFVPYALSPAARAGILANVLHYPATEGFYGITTLVYAPYLRYLFILGLIVYPFTQRDDDLIRRCLLGMLFFVTFTTGYASQYFVLPVALAALRPSAGSLVYAAAAALFLLLGGAANASLPDLTPVPANVVWAAAAFWFVTEQLRLFRARSPQPPPAEAPAPVDRRFPAWQAALGAAGGVAALLVTGWLLMRHAVYGYAAFQPGEAPNVQVVMPLLAPGEHSPDMDIPTATGARPCSLFDVMGHGYRVAWLYDFPACQGASLTVLCLNSQGQWTEEGISGLSVNRLAAQLRFTSAQDGTCGLFDG
jgi:hypothetical protein